MEENQAKRTVKKKFLTADKVGKTIKGFGGYALTFAVGALAKEALTPKKNENNSD